MLVEIESFRGWLKRKYPQTTTCVHYTSDVKLFFAWVDREPDRICIQDIDRFISYSQEQGHAIATINRRLAALRVFFDFFNLDKDEVSTVAQTNPVVPKRHFIKQGIRLPRDVEDATLVKLFGVVSQPRDRAMFLLMLRCGLRVGEIRSLSMNDLYLQPAPGMLPRLWLHGKGRKDRVVYLTAQVLSTLNDWLAVRPNTECDAVFLNRFAGRYSTTGIRRHLARYCDQAQVHMTSHQFRHTFGRQLAEHRVPVTTIQRLMGHSRLRTTETYIHISDTTIMADYDAAMRDITERLPLNQAGAA